WRLIVYGALWWLVFHVAVVAYEEPTLEQTFGKEDEAFRAVAPRWIPRMTPWRSKGSGARVWASRCLATGLGRFTGAASRHANGPRKRTSPHWRSGWVSGASQRATTNSLGTTSQPCASLPPWQSGFNQLSLDPHLAAVPSDGRSSPHCRGGPAARRDWLDRPAKTSWAAAARLGLHRRRHAVARRESHGNAGLMGDSQNTDEAYPPRSIFSRVERRLSPRYASLSR